MCDVRELPAPPAGKSEWPWTGVKTSFADRRPDGSDWPRISVVTPSFNQGQYIEATIRSILLQQYPNLEYIVIDGGSTDDSVDIIKKYDRWITHWESESDRGQAHAINKGLAVATGEVFNWINSDDFLAPDALALVGRAFVDCDMVAGGNVIFGNGLENRSRFTRGLTAAGLLRRDPTTELHQMAMWVLRDVAIELGGMDEEMHYAFDPDFFIRYLHVRPKVRYVDEILGWYRKHDGAKTVALQSNFIPERLHSIEKIRRDPALSSLREDARLAEQRYRWWMRLADIVNDPSSNNYHRALRVLVTSVRQPGLRWDRITRRTVKRLLKGQEIRPFTPVV